MFLDGVAYPLHSVLWVVLLPHPPCYLSNKGNVNCNFGSKDKVFVFFCSRFFSQKKFLFQNCSFLFFCSFVVLVFFTFSFFNSESTSVHHSGSASEHASKRTCVRLPACSIRRQASKRCYVRYPACSLGGVKKANE